MTKKITLVMLVLLIVSAFVFVSCEQEELGARTGKSTEEPKDNLLYNGYFDKSLSDTDVTGEGADTDIMKGVGIGGTNGMLVHQNEIYGQIEMDLTEKYGPGKSYYVEASFKLDPSGCDYDEEFEELTAYLSFSIVTGAAYEEYGQDYDLPGQYDGHFLSDADALELFNIKTNSEGEDISDGGWHTVSAVLSADTIAEVMANEDAGLLPENGESTMYKFHIVLLVGDYPHQDGYSYYLDNVYIKDLNPDKDQTGATYEEPDPEPEPEPEPEEEEEGEE